MTSPRNMQDILAQRRQATANAWDLDEAIVLVVAGEPIPKPGRGDQTYPFRAHTDYFYLADRERPGSVLAFDPTDGWVDFVPPISEQERIWCGGGVDDGVPVDGLAEWLEARRGRPLALLGAGVPRLDDGIELPVVDDTLSEQLHVALAQVRRFKDPVELDRMRRAVRSTAVAFDALPRLIRPGISERQLQIELEAELLHAGGDHLAYDTIVGGGPNGAVLHFSPTDRLLRDGELVLIDAGCEYRGYAADVTRTFPVNGRPTAQQADLYAVVLAAQRTAIEWCTAGREFSEVHLATFPVLFQGLIDLGYLRGRVDALIEQDIQSLFCPHGLGHLLGLGVRDVAGFLPGRERSEEPPLKFLRIDLPLQPSYVVTIEPGLYFIPALLQDPERRQQFRDAVVWDRVDTLMGFGGIRIEDDVLITDTGPEVLTAVIDK